MKVNAIESLIRRMSPRDRRAVTVGGAVLAVVLVLHFAVLPAIEAWQDAGDRIARARAELAQLEAQTGRHDEQRRRLAALLGPGATEAPRSVRDAELGFVELVEQTVQASGLSVSAIRPQPVRPIRGLEGYATVGVLVDGEAKLPQLIDCLNRLRELDQLTLVERLNATNTDGDGDLGVSMVLTTVAREAAGVARAANTDGDRG